MRYGIVPRDEVERRIRVCAPTRAPYPQAIARSLKPATGRDGPARGVLRPLIRYQAGAYGKEFATQARLSLAPAALRVRMPAGAPGPARGERLAALLGLAAHRSRASGCLCKPPRSRRCPPRASFLRLQAAAGQICVRTAAQNCAGDVPAGSGRAGTARNPSRRRAETSRRINESVPTGSGRVSRSVTARRLATRGPAPRPQPPKRLALQGEATDAKGISVCQSTRCLRERNWPTRRRAMG